MNNHQQLQTWFPDYHCALASAACINELPGTKPQNRYATASSASLGEPTDRFACFALYTLNTYVVIKETNHSRIFVKYILDMYSRIQITELKKVQWQTLIYSFEQI